MKKMYLILQILTLILYGIYCVLLNIQKDQGIITVVEQVKEFCLIFILYIGTTTLLEIKREKEL